MKTVSLKNFMKNKLKEYLNLHYKDYSFSFNYLYTLSKKDSRLAEQCQQYYLLNNMKLKSDKFSALTNKVFKSIKEYEQSNAKYFLEYNDYFNKKNNLKEVYRKQLMNNIKKSNVSMYWCSKVLHTNQSNLSEFFNKKQYNKLSLDKLKQLQNKLATKNTSY